MTMVTDEQVEQYRNESRREMQEALRRWRMDRMMTMLQRSEGATRSDLLRGGRIKASEVDSILAELHAKGRIETETTVTGGRPKTIIRAIGG